MYVQCLQLLLGSRLRNDLFCRAGR